MPDLKSDSIFKKRVLSNRASFLIGLILIIVSVFIYRFTDGNSTWNAAAALLGVPLGAIIGGLGLFRMFYNLKNYTLYAGFNIGAAILYYLIIFNVLIKFTAAVFDVSFGYFWQSVINNFVLSGSVFFGAISGVKKAKKKFTIGQDKINSTSIVAALFPFVLASLFFGIIFLILGRDSLKVILDIFNMFFPVSVIWLSIVSTSLYLLVTFFAVRTAFSDDVRRKIIIFWLVLILALFSFTVDYFSINLISKQLNLIESGNQ